MKQLSNFRPSPAMVVACIALTVALGGTSVAAIQALPRNSVGTKQLKRNAVNGAKVANNSLRGADVNEASLGTVPRAANAVPSGAAGGALAGTYPNPALADGSVTSTKIAAGAVGVSKFGVIPAARASRGDVPQTIPTGGTVKDVLFDSETFDTANLHSTTTNSHQLVAPIAGVYQITGNVRWEGNAAGTRFVDITTSAGGRIASVWSAPPSTFNTDQSISATYVLNTGQSVFLQVFQNSGVSLNLVKDGTDDPNLSMVWIGPATAGAPGIPARPARPAVP